jgi:hypothetical protein
MTREQEFRKQTEEAKFEAFSVMCEKVNAELKEKLGDVQMQKAEQLTKAKEIIKGLLIILHEIATDEYDFEKACPYQYKEAKDFLGGE